MSRCSRPSFCPRASARPLVGTVTVRILVTGAAGFIGSAYVRHVLREQPDDEVFGLDLLTYAGNLANLDEVRDDRGSASFRATSPMPISSGRLLGTSTPSSISPPNRTSIARCSIPGHSPGRT